MITKKPREITSNELRTIVGLKIYSQILYHNRIGAFHTRTNRYDIHYIGINSYLIQLKSKVNNYLFE